MIQAEDIELSPENGCQLLNFWFTRPRIQAGEVDSLCHFLGNMHQPFDLNLQVQDVGSPAHNTVLYFILLRLIDSICGANALYLVY